MNRINPYRYSILAIFLVSCFYSFAQSDHKELRKGDKAYLEQEFSQAEEQYRKALAKKESTKGTYNLGNSIYSQSRYEEAIDKYLKAAELSSDKNIKSNALYNLGNAYFNSQQYDKSVESYIDALKLDPADLDTKRNLSLARQMLQMQQQQQQQQQNQEDQENQEDEEEKDQNQDQQQLDEQEEGEEDKQQQQQQEKQEEEKSQNQSQEEKELSDEEARQLLKIIEEEEQRVQEKVRKTSGDKRKPEKDW